MSEDNRLRMPAEWERQEAVWLAWPHNHEDWPGKYAPIPWVYAEVIRYLSQVERVRLIVKNPEQRKQALAILRQAGARLEKIDCVYAPTNRVWLRDSGATVVKRGNQRLLLDWRFTAWAKYQNWKKDDGVPMFMEKFLGLERIQPTINIRGRETRVVLEGGSIDVNGQGTLLTTEECLLSRKQQRNPGMSREDYEFVFSEYLGISQVVWLENGIIGDDTHGHVDDLARFVNPSTVVTVVEKSKSDPNHDILNRNLQLLKKARDQKGRQLNVVELPMPKAFYFDGQRLPASYANFLIANNLVLVPTFNDVHDRMALQILADIFPDHEVVGIFCGDFIWGLGTIHCASQQEPAL